MAEEIIICGKTVEEAMAKALAEHSGSNVSYEVLAMPKKGFLGIGASPAKIKVIIEEEEEDADLSSIVASIKGLGVTTNKGGDGEKAEKQPEKKVEKKPEAKKPEKKAKAEKKPEKVEKTEKKPEPKAEKVEAKPEKKAEVKIKEPKVFEVTELEKKVSLDFINNLLVNMGVDATTAFDGSETTGEGGNTYPRIVISGEGAGILIGHHGETLDAIQYLVNLCAHRKGDGTGKDFVKIVVDIEDYRAKREETLRSLARRMAAKAVKYKRNVVLEPMNPFERRIIHSEIQGMENVSTHSVGSDENRKIVVCYEGADKVERRRRPRYNKPAEKTAE